LIKVPNFNFGYPNVSFEAGISNLRKTVQTFDGQIERVVIGDWSLGNEQSFNYPESVLNLNGLYIWNRSIFEHPLYELVFLSLVSWLDNPAVQLKIPSGPLKKKNAFRSSEESARWLNDNIRSYTKALTELKSELSKQDIDLTLLLGPNPEQLSSLRKQANELIRVEASRLNIRLIDIDACFKTKVSNLVLVFTNKDFLSVEGNKLFAKCFDKYFN
jgi:hypothetical protein